MAPRSDPDPERRQHHPAARLRGVPGARRRTPPGSPARPSRPATATSTPPRCTATRRASVRRSAPPGSRVTTLFVTSKLNNGFHEPDDGPQGVRPDAGRPRPRPGRPVPHPLAAAHAVRRRLRVHLEDPARVPAATAAPAPSASPTSSPPTSSGWPRRPTWCPAVNQIEVHPYFTNEAARAADATHGILTEAWSPDRPGRRPRRRDHHQDRRARGAYAGPGDPALAPRSAATSSSRSPRHRSGWRRTSRSSTSSSTTTAMERSPRSTAARTAAPARTRTSSTSSPTERAPNGTRQGSRQSIVTRMTLLPFLASGSKTRNRFSPVRPVMM